MEAGSHAEFPDNGGFIEGDAGAAVQLHDAGADDALAEILIGRTNDDAIDARIAGGEGGGGGEGVIGLEFDHGPDDDAGGGEDFFQQIELGEEVGVNAFAGFVAGPEAVAKGLDDVIGGNGEVGGTGVKHAEDGGQDTTHGGDFAAIAIAG